MWQAAVAVAVWLAASGVWSLWDWHAADRDHEHATQRLDGLFGADRLSEVRHLADDDGDGEVRP